MRRFKGCLAAAATAAFLLATASANADGVPAPAHGTTGNVCYENCMQHYRDFNNMVTDDWAKQCAHGCHYAPVVNTENGECKAACASTYNTCMANSPDPANDRDCPINDLKCERDCYR